MTLKEVSAEQFAAAFHNYHEALASDFGDSDARNESWSEVPAAERQRMIEAARLALLEIETSSTADDERRRWFARPGQAEWGC
jgi:hypothetical protein